MKLLTLPVRFFVLMGESRCIESRPGSDRVLSKLEANRGMWNVRLKLNLILSFVFDQRSQKPDRFRGQDLNHKKVTIRAAVDVRHSYEKARYPQILRFDYMAVRRDAKPGLGKMLPVRLIPRRRFVATGQVAPHYSQAGCEGCRQYQHPTAAQLHGRGKAWPTFARELRHACAARFQDGRAQ